jgi:hypothetical protein
VKDSQKAIEKAKLFSKGAKGKAWGLHLECVG